MARMEGYTMGPSNVQAPVHRENCGAPSENVALILPHFARALAASQHSALPFSTQLPHAGPRGGARSGSVLVSKSAFRWIPGPRWRVFDAHSTVSMAHLEYILWELMKSICDSGIQDELAWASGGRCEFSYSFWAGRTYR